MKWNQRVTFRDLLDDFDDNADEIKEIERVKPLWIERFNSINSLKHFSEKLKDVETLSQFNKWLDLVYDYCDMSGIWVNI